MEAEGAGGGELTDQHAVGAARVHPLAGGQGRPGVVDHLEAGRCAGERGEVEQAADVVGQRRARARDAAIVAREARVHAAGGEVTVGVRGAQHAELLGGAAATGGAAGGARRVHRDVAVEGRALIDATGLARDVRAEVVVVPEGGRRREIQRVKAHAAAWAGLRRTEHLVQLVAGGHVHEDTVHLRSRSDREAAVAEVVVDHVGIGLRHRVEFLHDDAFQALGLGRQGAATKGGPQQEVLEVLVHGSCD